MSPPFALYVDGVEYAGWKSLRVTRGMTRASADFDLTVSERWTLADNAWQILPGSACEVRALLGGEPLLSGWVDTYRPSYNSSSHSVRLSGRSKTCDLVDSSVLVDGGQFRGMTVGEIAEVLAEPFDIEVLARHDGEPEPEVQVQQGETCFALIERLSRLQALLVTDDAAGRLVLTRAGAGRASTALRHGQNILSASADLDESKRFSECLVKAQRPGNDNKSDDDAESGGVAFASAAARLGEITNVCERYRARRALARASGSRRGNPRSLTEVHGGMRDPDITRYRPLLIVAETQSDDALAEQRAEWELRRRVAEGTKAVVTVNGWRQLDGGLWDINLMVQVEAPWLALNREMIVSELTYTYDDSGERTTLELTLPDAFLPDPARKAKAAPEAASSGRRSPSARQAAGKRDPWADLFRPAES
jgi:prophage tail gpP-like protein